MRFVEPGGKDAIGFEDLEPGGESIWRNALETLGQILETPWSFPKEIAQDEDRPPLTNDVEGPSDRAVESVTSNHSGNLDISLHVGKSLLTL